VQLVKNTTSFRGSSDRFRDPALVKKALIPGPGAYEGRDPLFGQR